MEENIFIQIMELIENKTDMPRLEKDIEDWLQKDRENKAIYEIYKLASNTREI